ncbi:MULTISPECIES: hypothetical protein [Saccharibacillus]|uniref:hypothetical protein n=1 Tax=Saccharibacillus TaxID=456492 RepID=UPI00123C25F4|nr:hypothetical protein [Saccharibacillus sp. WB 17]MWJ33670.1 hypothetical protein [Saccharibacillus sp. WB 17]
MKIHNKINRAIPRLLASALLLGSLAACSSAPSVSEESKKPLSLAGAEQQVNNLYPGAGIPSIEGVKLTAVYKEKAFSPSEALGATDEQQPAGRTDSLTFLYADQKGEIDQAAQKALLADGELLYGPYSGTNRLRLTLSELPVQTAGAENRSVDGTQLQVAHAEDGSLIATARSGEVTYTLAGEAKSKQEEEIWLGILAQVSH